MKLSEAMQKGNGWGYVKSKRAHGLTAVPGKCHLFKDGKSLCGRISFDSNSENFFQYSGRKCAGCVNVQKAWPSLYGAFT